MNIECVIGVGTIHVQGIVHDVTKSEGKKLTILSVVCKEWLLGTREKVLFRSSFSWSGHVAFGIVDKIKWRIVTTPTQILIRHKTENW